MKRWLSRKQAAERVGRSTRTIIRWEAAAYLKPVAGHYREDELLDVDRIMRERRAHTGERRAPSPGPDVLAFLRRMHEQLIERVASVDPHGAFEWDFETVDGPGENEVTIRASPTTRTRASE